MLLPKRLLGMTELRITRVGFGAGSIGGTGWHSCWNLQDDAAAIAAIRRAIDLGVNWIDTAPVYGFGHSEEIVARALREIPSNSRPYVFTKCGLVWNSRDWTAPPLCVGSQASMRREIESSLRRLRIDCIDLYHMHRPAQDGTRLDAYLETLLTLKAEGKVRAIGLSNHDVTRLHAAERLGHVDTVQTPFSVIRREAAATELPWCAAFSVGGIVYSPMHAGLLSGAFTADRAMRLPAEDGRSHCDEFHGVRLGRNLALADALKPIAERYDTTIGAIAVAWTLAWRGVTGTIVGARNPTQVDGWIRAATLELTQQDLREVASAIRRTGAGTGPLSPHIADALAPRKARSARSVEADAIQDLRVRVTA